MKYIYIYIYKYKYKYIYIYIYDDELAYLYYQLCDTEPAHWEVLVPTRNH